MDNKLGDLLLELYWATQKLIICPVHRPALIRPVCETCKDQNASVAEIKRCRELVANEIAREIV